MWAVSAAVMLGALTAIISSAGATPLWLPILLLAIVAVPTAVTVASRRSRASAGSTVNEASASAFAKQEPTLPDEQLIRSVSEHQGPRATRAVSRLTDQDWDELNRVCCALGSNHLDWLRMNDFHIPWLDARGRPIAEIEPLVAGLVDRPFPIRIAGALLVLVGSLEEFVEFYSENTSSDPILRDTDWRFFDWSDPDLVEESASSSAAWYERAARLQLLSRTVAEAYSDLTTAAAGHSRIARYVAVLA